VTTVTIPAGGGSATFAGGKISISFPAGAANGAITLKVSTPIAQPPNTMFVYGPAIDIQAFDASGIPLTTFNKNVTITFFYDQLNFLIWPDMRIYTKTAGGDWAYVPSTEYVAGQKAVKATVNHFSSYALFGSDSYNYDRMIGDDSGNIYVMSSNGLSVFRLAPGATVPTLYADLSSVLGWGSSLGDLTRDPLTGDLYIGNGSTVYRFTSARKLSTFYTLPLSNEGNAVNGLNFSPSFNALFISAVYDTYQVDPASGLIIRNIETGSRQVVTDSKKRFFAVANSNSYIADSTDSMIWFYPDIANNYQGVHHILGFLGVKRLAVDRDDNIYVPNQTGNTISVVSGPDWVVTGAIRGIQGPSNVTVAGDNLVVATGGGLQVIPRTRRDPSTAKPKILELPTISGKGSQVQIYGGDPVPANNILRINGKVLHTLIGYRPGVNLTTYDLLGDESNDGPIGPSITNPLQSPTTPLYQVQVTIGDALVLDDQLHLPEPGNFKDIYSGSYDLYLATGEWGIFHQLNRVVSAEGLFDEWNYSAQKGSSLAYQFTQAGDFHFTTYLGGTAYALTVHVSAGGRPTDPGWCIGTLYGGIQVDPVAGAIYRAYGASIEIPPAALPGTAFYKLYLNICDTPYAGKDSVTSHSFNYQFQLTPEPTALLKDLTIRLPYDPSLSPGPVAGFMDPALGDVDMLPFSLADGKVVITVAAGSYSNPASGAAPASLNQPAALLGRINTILGGLWWGVGLPNAEISNAHFVIYFNTRDCDPSYAQGLMNYLLYARDKYIVDDYPLPYLPVFVKIAPWIASKARPGATIGAEGVFHLFFNNKLSATDLQDTAAHELFHVVQREAIAPEDLLLTPNWWLEGTATWAQYLVYPDHTGYLEQITGALDFPNVPFSNWGSLSPEQQYATMALAQYMVKTVGPDVILKVLQNLNSALSMQSALELAIGGQPWGTFYTKWAKDYWMQTYAPVDQWNLGAAMKVLKPADAITLLVNGPIGGLSSGVIKSYYDPTLPKLPPSFTDGVGSVIRMPASCISSEVYVFDKAKKIQGDFINSVPVDQVIYMNKIASYSLTSPVYTLYINGGSDCTMQVVWEAPTLLYVSVFSVQINTTTLITLNGNGFGPTPGVVLAGGSSYPPVSWNASQVTFNLPSGNTPGIIHVQVQPKGGAISNPMSITITP
jgi:hypothetical protein